MITFVLQISSSAVSAPLVLATQLTRTRQILAPATPTAYRLPPTAPPPPLPNNTTFSGSGRQWVWANKKRNECTPMWYCVLYSGCPSSFLSSISVRLLSLSFDKHNNKKIRQTTTTTTSGCTILFADAPNLAPIIFSNSPCSSLFAFHFFSSSIFLPYMKENDCTYI